MERPQPMNPVNDCSSLPVQPIPIGHGSPRSVARASPVLIVQEPFFDGDARH